MRMLKARIALATALLGASAVLSLTAGSTAHAAGTDTTTATTTATYQGCPSGYVCLYPGAGWNGGNPSHFFYTYGAHNLSNVFGVHRLFNNQTGGAIVRNCLGYDGTRCQGAQAANTYWDYDYTPYNSVFLAPR